MGFSTIATRCPHLTTPLYCICREQGHDPAGGCLVSISVVPRAISGDCAAPRTAACSSDRPPVLCSLSSESGVATEL